MWKEFEFYSLEIIVLVRKGRLFYATLYQMVFLEIQGGVHKEVTTLRKLSRFILNNHKTINQGYKKPLL